MIVHHLIQYWLHKLIQLRSHDLTEVTRAMAKRGSDDLKKLTALQATLVRLTLSLVPAKLTSSGAAPTQDITAEDFA